MSPDRRETFHKISGQYTCIKILAGMLLGRPNVVQSVSMEPFAFWYTGTNKQRY